MKERKNFLLKVVPNKNIKQNCGEYKIKEEICELEGREKEAYQLVHELNEMVYNDETIISEFHFSSNSWACAIYWGERCIWTSEDEQQYEEDNEIPIKTLIVKEVKRCIDEAVKLIAKLE